MYLNEGIANTYLNESIANGPILVPWVSEINSATGNNLMLLSCRNQLNVYLLLIQKSSYLGFELCFVFMFYMSLLLYFRFVGLKAVALFTGHSFHSW